MDFTLVICTHNRAADLDRTLESIAANWQAERTTFDVLVVDNHSTDDTRAVADRWAARFTRPFRYSFAPVLGLSNARNHALEQERGELTLFLDDDINARPGTLDAYADAAARFQRTPFFGGPIVPVFDFAPTDFALAVARVAPSVFSGLNLGPTPQVLSPGRGPWGANMCLRSASLGDARFDPRLSYYGRGGIVGDETEFLARLTAKHGAGQWVPGATVEHRIPAHRATRAFMKRYSVGVGRAAVRAGLVSGSAGTLTRRKALWYWRRALASTLRALASHGSIDDNVAAWYRAWTEQGTARETWSVLGRTSPDARRLATND